MISKIKNKIQISETKGIPEVSSYKEEMRKFKNTLEQNVDPLNIDKIMSEPQTTKQITREE